MATKIVTKNSSTASAVPTASDLVQGELAVNVADKRLFTEDNGGAIVELGTNPSTIDINAGTIDGTAIGASSASTGAFTTLTASGAFTSVGIDDNADATAITIDSSENVGIGSATANHFSTAGTTNVLGVKSTSGGLISIAATGTNFSGVDLGTDSIRRGGMYSLDGSHLTFYTNATNSGTALTERMRIDSAGNVGIGTSSPQSDGNTTNLEVSSAFGARVLIANTDTNGRKYGFYSSNSGIFGLADYTASGTPTRMAIDSSGNVGIGTTSPSGAYAQPSLHIHASGNGAELHLTDGTTGATSSDGMSIFQYANDGYIHMRENGSLRTYINGSERMRIDSSGRVGIGTTSPSSELHIASASPVLTLQDTNSTEPLLTYIDFKDSGGTLHGYVGYGSGVSDWLQIVNSYDDIVMYTGSSGTPSEAMRIDASGNLLVGTTSIAVGQGTSTGVSVRGPTGRVEASASGTTSAIFNRTTSDGGIVNFAKDGTTVGSIGSVFPTSTRYFYISGTLSGVGFYSNGIYPSNNTGNFADNSKDLGSSSVRWDDVYATNGTIQTSDRNEKQDIAELSEAEQRVAVACKGLLRKFRWKDSVAEKGDDARIHFGIIAQDLQAAFEAEGLDASRYAMWCSDTWWEQDVEVPAVEAVDAVYETQTDEEGNETQVLVQEAVEAVDAYTRTDTFETAEEAPEGATEKTRLGVRYSELLAFIISAI